MLIIGIDPGLSGAVSFYHTEGGGLTVEDMPVFYGKRKSLNTPGLAQMVEFAIQGKPVHAFVEEVHALPGEGGVGAFAFGKVYGEILGVLAANYIPITLVSPQTWKKAMGVPRSGNPNRAKARTENKELARQYATRLMPRHAGSWGLKKHSDRAEAALIALYGARQMTKEAVNV